MGELAEVSSGGTPNRNTPEFWNGEIPWITTSLINFNVIREAEEFITEQGVKGSSAKLFPRNTILMAMYGQGRTRGQVAILGIEATTNQACAAIIPKSDLIDHSFLFQNLLKRYDEIRDLSNQGGQQNLSGGIIKGIEILFPTVSEQSKIAELLSKIDSRIETQSKIIEEVKSLINSLMEKIFSRQFRFKNSDGSNYPDWRKMTLGDVGDVKMCRRIFNEETSTAGEIPFFKIGSFGKKADAYIPRRLYEEYRRRFSFPKKGDVLISAAGTIGRTVVYNGEDAYFQDSNIVWIDNDSTKVTNDILFYVLQIVKYNTEGGTIQRLYNNVIKSTNFICPDIPEQIKISTFLSRLDQRIEIEKKLLRGYENQKQYLLQNLLI